MIVGWQTHASASKAAPVLLTTFPPAQRRRCYPSSTCLRTARPSSATGSRAPATAHGRASPAKAGASMCSPCESSTSAGRPCADISPQSFSVIICQGVNMCFPAIKSSISRVSVTLCAPWCSRYVVPLCDGVLRGVAIELLRSAVCFHASAMLTSAAQAPGSCARVTCQACFTAFVAQLPQRPALKPSSALQRARRVGPGRHAFTGPREPPQHPATVRLCNVLPSVSSVHWHSVSMSRSNNRCLAHPQRRGVIAAVVEPLVRMRSAVDM